MRERVLLKLRDYKEASQSVKELGFLDLLLLFWSK